MKEYFLECLCTFGLILSPFLISGIVITVEEKYNAYCEFKQYCEKEKKKKESFRKMVRYSS